jgi:hypothetical protein
MPKLPASGSATEELPVALSGYQRLADPLLNKGTG